MKSITLPVDSLDTRFTYQTQPIKMTEPCVSRTPAILETQYPTVQTQRVPYMGDTSSSTTTGPTLRFLMGILCTHSVICVKWKFMVRIFIFKRPMFVHVRYLIEKIDDHLFVCIPLEVLDHNASNIWKYFTYHKHCFNIIWYLNIFNVLIRMSNTRILWRGLFYTVPPELSGRSLSHYWGNMSRLYRWI